MAGTITEEERRAMLERLWAAELDAVSRIVGDGYREPAERRAAELRARLKRG